MKQLPPGRQADRRLQLVRHDRRVDDGRHAATGRQEPRRARACSKAAQSRSTRGEPVHAAGDPASGPRRRTTSRSSTSTCTATTTASGCARAGSACRWLDAGMGPCMHEPAVGSLDTRSTRGGHTHEETDQHRGRSRRRSRSLVPAVVIAATSAYTSPKLEGDGTPARRPSIKAPLRSGPTTRRHAPRSTCPTGTRSRPRQAPGTRSARSTRR